MISDNYLTFSSFLADTNYLVVANTGAVEFREVKKIKVYVKKGGAFDAPDLSKDTQQITLYNLQITALRKGNHPVGDPDSYWFVIETEKASGKYECIDKKNTDDGISDACVKIDAYAHFGTTETPGGTSAGAKKVSDEIQAFYYLPSQVLTPASTQSVTKRVISEPGSKSNHISASFEIGAVTLGLGHSTMKSNKAGAMKTKTNYIGVNGGIDDTGLDWRAWYRTKEHADGTKTKPWGIGLGKDLGGGAWAYVEHWNDGVKGAKKSSGTVVGLGVSF